MTLNYQELNKTHRYQLLDDDLVACQEWTVFVNGGPEEGGHAVLVTMPLPDCPEDKREGFMRVMREKAIQGVRQTVREQHGLVDPIRVRIDHVKPTFLHASQLPWMVDGEWVQA